MKTGIEPTPKPEAEQAVRDRAFLMWEMEGKAEGRAEDYWERARERIEAETHSAYPPAQASKHRT
jgi:ABC-type thiamine transport system substrate-binding protein